MPQHWKTALIVAAGVAVVVLYLRPHILDGFTGPEKPGDDSALKEAQLRGRLGQAAQFHSEVGSRLAAYKARFDCEAAAVLDEQFLDPHGALSLHPLRGAWFETRRELSEHLEVYEYWSELIAKTDAEIAGNPAKVELYATVPARATSADKRLDAAIKSRAQTLPRFTVLAQQLINARAKGGGR
jgi:hypothetical protein